jgi:hypothetical protein
LPLLEYRVHARRSFSQWIGRHAPVNTECPFPGPKGQGTSGNEKLKNLCSNKWFGTKKITRTHPALGFLSILFWRGKPCGCQGFRIWRVHARLRAL